MRGNYLNKAGTCLSISFGRVYNASTLTDHVVVDNYGFASNVGVNGAYLGMVAF
jgi:hypothetical protein